MAEHILECIIKVTERCNLNCSYCYYFNKDNQAWKDLPPRLEPETAEAICDFIANAVRHSKISRVKIDLHGGEPLLLGVEKINDFCTALRRTVVGAGAECEISLQTNGLLLNAQWIDLLGKQQIQLGVSCDGPATYHDSARKDKRGRATHERLHKKLQQLVVAHQQGLIKPPGIICVINPQYEAGRVFNYFAQDLGIKKMHFILPDHNHQDLPEFKPEALQHYLLALYKAWLTHGDGKVSIRLLDKLFDGAASAQATDNFREMRSGEPIEKTVLTIQTNGQIFPDDSLRNLPLWQEIPVFNVKHDAFASVFNHRIYRNLKFHQQHAPACIPCKHYTGCRGQSLLSRYSTEGRFNNISIYCRPIYALADKISRDVKKASTELGWQQCA